VLNGVPNIPPADCKVSIYLKIMLRSFVELGMLNKIKKLLLHCGWFITHRAPECYFVNILKPGHLKIFILMLFSKKNTALVKDVGGLTCTTLSLSHQLLA
jgi:hypothetical protein